MEFIHPILVGNYLTLYSNFFALSIHRSVWDMRIVAVTLVFFRYLVVFFESRYNMVGKFPIEHSCGAFGGD